MKRFLILLLIMFCFASLSSAKNLTEEVYDSISHVFIREIDDFFGGLVDAEEEFHKRPLNYRYLIYDLIEDTKSNYISEFNEDVGVYQIFNLSCITNPYFIVIDNDKYYIYDWVEKKMIKHVRRVLDKAGVGEIKKQRVIKKLEKEVEIQKQYRKRTSFL